MRSSHADIFNHDDDAPTYDAEVLQEGHPIRQGYSDLLEWVAQKAAITSQSRVLELGSGTGNLTRLLPLCRELICVDVSQKMEEWAQPKVEMHLNRRFRCADVLEVLDEDMGRFDAIVSTYTLHHLTEPEKTFFFQQLKHILEPTGRAVIGDLMLVSASVKPAQIALYRSLGELETAEGIEEEFFWDLKSAREQLQQLGFRVEERWFSDLSAGICAQRVTEP